MEAIPSTQDEIFAPPAPRGIAPVWHTAVLIAGLIVLSIAGAREMASADAGAHTNRLGTYASTAVSQLFLLGWVWLGLRLRKIPLLSLLGDLSGGAKKFFLDAGIAVVFWFGSLMVLGTVGMTWMLIDMARKHQSLFGQAGKHLPPDPAQQHLVHTLTALAPSTGLEMLAWACMCVMAGFIEEMVFRGYFQRQFSAWGRGAIWAGVVGSAIMFGASHGYQGIRNMVLLTIFGALFSGLAVVRRNLRVGMMAHAWHDFFVGLLIAFAHAKHLL